VQIVAIGEQTGKLDELLLNAADTFDADADAAIAGSWRSSGLTDPGSGPGHRLYHCGSAAAHCYDVAQRRDALTGAAGGDTGTPVERGAEVTR